MKGGDADALHPVDPDASGGQTARQILNLVDVFPTVLDTMGIAAPARLGIRLGQPAADRTRRGRRLVRVVESKGVALSTIDGSFSIRADVPGRGDFRYTEYPDATQEL